MVVKEGTSSAFSDVLDRVFDPEEGKFLVKWKGALPTITSEAKFLVICGNYAAIARKIGGMGASELWDKLFSTSMRLCRWWEGPWGR